MGTQNLSGDTFKPKIKLEFSGGKTPEVSCKRTTKNPYCLWIL